MLTFNKNRAVYIEYIAVPYAKKVCVSLKRKIKKPLHHYLAHTPAAYLMESDLHDGKHIYSIYRYFSITRNIF